MRKLKQSVKRSIRVYIREHTKSCPLQKYINQLISLTKKKDFRELASLPFKTMVYCLKPSYDTLHLFKQDEYH